MKKLIGLIICSILLAPVAFATAVEEGVNTPEQTTQNTKGFAGINYNRQDIEEPGRQVIINDHSAFNININIFKKGALFKKDEKTAE